MTQKVKNLWDQLEREQLLDLKKNLDKAHSLGLGDGVTCHVRILNRGEQLFFLCVRQGLHGPDQHDPWPAVPLLAQGLG